MAGIVAIIEIDLKKIIALSTLRQLGVIIASIALGMPTLALFHLITHALFKALLFMCAGRLIHLTNHNQDLRMVGNIIHQIPLTRAAFIISNIALCGLPFLAGFYSKDLILEYRMFININFLIIILIALATGLTARYSIRFLLIG
jgi:NADH-ubiquinone oxidoreductase chain 5